jgi:hypothetical protein
MSSDSVFTHHSFNVISPTPGFRHFLLAENKHTRLNRCSDQHTTNGPRHLHTVVVHPQPRAIGLP